MIQKKVCMVGVFGTGKTSLVQQYVYSRFTAKYHSTVGVKIDRKLVDADGTELTLVLWDLEGKDASQDINGNYLRGAHGIIYVVDGTRRETFDELPALSQLAREAAGDVPSIVALNKADLADQWTVQPADEQGLLAGGHLVIKTSAKTGVGVEDVFSRLGRATLAPREGGA